MFFIVYNNKDVDSLLMKKLFFAERQNFLNNLESQDFLYVSIKKLKKKMINSSFEGIRLVRLLKPNQQLNRTIT